MKRRSVIFIHGIGPIEEGYSNTLWDVLWQGGDPGDIHRYEVYYYDIFKKIGEKTEIETFIDRCGVLGVVDDFIKNEDMLAVINQTLTTVLKDTISHVLYFLLHEDTRIAIINRFRKILANVIKEGINENIFPGSHEITIISHSLGTVVAYVGLHTVIGEAELGITDGVKIKNLFTLATPLAAIKEICSRVPGINMQFIGGGLKKPQLWNEDEEVNESNIEYWFSYRHQHDPVASLIPIKGNSIDSNDNLPFVFNVVHQKNVHAFENYISQAGDLIRGQIGEVL